MKFLDNRVYQVLWKCNCVILCNRLLIIIRQSEQITAEAKQSKKKPTYYVPTLLPSVLTVVESSKWRGPLMRLTLFVNRSVARFCMQRNN